jgi:hypothetical protein
VAVQGAVVNTLKARLALEAALTQFLTLLPTMVALILVEGAVVSTNTQLAVMVGQES